MLGKSTRLRVTRYGFVAAPWVGLAFTLALFAQMTVRPVRILAAHDPLSRFAGWRQLAADTAPIVTARQAGYVATNEHSLGATMAFYLPNSTVFQTSDAIRYDFMPPIDQALLGRTTGLYLALAASDDIVRLRPHFDLVELIATIWRTWNGDPIEPYRVYELRGYRGGVPY